MQLREACIKAGDSAIATLALSPELCWSSSKSGAIFLIQVLLDAKTHVLEKYIKFSSGLFLNNSCWYNLSWNYHLEAQ